MGKSLISIDTLALDMCSDMGDSVGRHKAKLTRYLISGYSEVSRYIGNSFSVKTAVLKYDNAIELPCDFVYETKVGVRRNGYTAMLTLDHNVQREKLNDTETEKYLNNIWTNGYQGHEGYWFYNAYAGGMFLGELYGAGRCVLNGGTYSIDKDQGVIYIGSHIPEDAEIVIEYKSDGFSEGLSLVPIEMKDTLENWALYKFYAHKNPSLSENFHDKYKKAYNKIQRLYNYESALYATGKINEMFSATNY